MRSISSSSALLVFDHLVGAPKAHRPSVVLIRLRSVRNAKIISAQRNKLLAHDNKPHASRSDKSTRCFPAGQLLTCAISHRTCPALQIASGHVVARAVPQFLSLFGRIQGSIVCKVSHETFSKLRIAQVYIKLLGILEGKSEARMVSLAWIGDYEVRMFEGSQVSSAHAPLFWMELFGHNARASVDSCNYHEIEDGGTLFQDFIYRQNVRISPLRGKGTKRKVEHATAAIRRRLTVRRGWRLR